MIEYTVHPSIWHSPIFPQNPIYPHFLAMKMWQNLLIYHINSKKESGNPSNISENPKSSSDSLKTGNRNFSY